MLLIREPIQSVVWTGSTEQLKDPTPKNDPFTHQTSLDRNVTETEESDHRGVHSLFVQTLWITGCL